MHWVIKNLCDALYCVICFIVVVWKQTHNLQGINKVPNKLFLSIRNFYHL